MHLIPIKIRNLSGDFHSFRLQLCNFSSQAITVTNFLLLSLIKIAVQDVSIEDFFNLPALNVIWRLVNGRRFEYSDERLKQLVSCIEAFTMEKAVGPIAGIKLLIFIPPFNKIYKNIQGTKN